jgi:hypothetical protein
MSTSKRTASNLRCCIYALLDDEERGVSRIHLDNLLGELANQSNLVISVCEQLNAAGYDGEEAIRQLPAIVEALKLSREYVYKTHSVIAAANHNNNSVVRPDLDKVDSILSLIRPNKPLPDASEAQETAS